MLNNLLLSYSNHPASNDDDLVCAAQRNPAAFNALYQRYATRMYRYLCVRAASNEDAADLMQQVFIRAFAALPSYRPRGLPFSAWLFRIAANLLTDAHRRSRPMLDISDLPEAMHPASPHDVERDVLRREAIMQVRALLAQLPAEQYELISLRFMAELTIGEIAQVLGKSEATIYRHMAQTLNTLKEQYSHDETND